MKVGFVGLGLMGGAISSNLLASGYEVAGYDLLRKPLKAFEARGGVPASSAREVAERSDLVLLSLPTEEAVEAAVLGREGVRAGARRGLVVADLSTVHPDTSIRMARALGEVGVPFLDATVSGNRRVAEERGLTMMVGGPREAYERCLPVFREVSRRQFYIGPSGHGTLMKLVVNLVGELNRTALAEGLMLGLRGGIEGKLLLEVLAAGSAYSRQVDLKGERMVRGEFGDPEATIRMCLKDAELMLRAGGSLGVPLPLTALRAQLYRGAAQMGHKEDDPASVMGLYHKLAGEAGAGARNKAVPRRPRGRSGGGARP